MNSACYQRGFHGKLIKRTFHQEKRRRNMEKLQEEARKRGLKQIGEPIRRFDLEPNHLYEIYLDEYDNEYVFRRGILTIVAADGTVY